MRGQARPGLAASALIGGCIHAPEPSKRREELLQKRNNPQSVYMHARNSPSPVPGPSLPSDPAVVDPMDVDMQIPSSITEDNLDLTLQELESQPEAALAKALETVWSGEPRRHAYIEDVPDEDDSISQSEEDEGEELWDPAEDDEDELEAWVKEMQDEWAREVEDFGMASHQPGPLPFREL
jgi:hypothetical protein